MSAHSRNRTDVTQEYPAVGKHRVRVIRTSTGKHLLDVREYVATETFEGFTRRGVKLSSREELLALRDILSDVIERGVIE